MNLKLPGNQFLCDAWIRCDTCTCRTAVKYFACFMVEKCIPRITFVIATAEQNALNGADIATYASAILVATTFFSIKIKQAKAYWMGDCTPKKTFYGRNNGTWPTSSVNLTDLQSGAPAKLKCPRKSNRRNRNAGDKTPELRRTWHFELDFWTSGYSICWFHPTHSLFHPSIPVSTHRASQICDDWFTTQKAGKVFICFA